MSLRDSIEIQEKQAALRKTPLQRIAAIAPLVFLALFLLGSFSSIFRSHPGREVPELQIYVFGLFAALVSLFAYQRANRRKIAELEVEVLKLKRKQNAQNQK